MVRRKFRKLLQYVSISIEPAATLGIGLCIILNTIQSLRPVAMMFAWPVSIAVIVFACQAAIVRCRMPNKLSGVVLQAHLRRLHVGRCPTGRILMGVRDLEAEELNVIRIKSGARVYKVIIDSAVLIEPGTSLLIRFGFWDPFLRLPVYRIVRKAARSK